MNETELKAFQESLITELGAVMDEKTKTAIEEKLKEVSTKEDLENIKEEIKSVKRSLKFAWNETDAYKSVITNIFKAVKNQAVSNESQFKAIADAEVQKAINETTLTDGGHGVFTQFEKDIIREMKTKFPVVDAIKWYNIQKWDKLNIPTVTNGITSAWVSEWSAGSASQPVWGTIALDTNKLWSLIEITEELLEDSMATPDLYDLLVGFVAESQGAFLSEEILNGTGTGTSKVVGIRNLVGVGVSVANTATSTSALTRQDILAVEGTLPEKYATDSDCVWVMSRYVFYRLRGLSDESGLLFPELSQRKLDGYDVIIDTNAGVNSSVTDVAGGVYAIFGNIKKFVWAKRKGFTAELGYSGTGFASGTKSLRVIQRLDAKSARNDAFVLAKLKD